MDTTPLPNQDSDFSDNGSDDETASLPSYSSEVVHYVIRITSHSKFTTQQLLDFFHAEPEIFKYVISRETIPQEHFHLVVSVDQSVQEQAVRDIIKAFIVPFWQVYGKLPKGFGNKQYSMELCKDLDKAVSYAVKQGEYWHEGYTLEYINERKAQSFEKKKVSNFKAEYLELCQRFQESDMDIREFMIKYVQLKAKYGQQVNMSHAYGYALSNLVARDPTEAESFVDNYLYKQ